MTIVEYFAPLLKAKGFTKTRNHFRRVTEGVEQFVSFQKMVSFDDHHLSFGIHDQELPLAYKVRDSLGCEIQVNATTLAQVNGFRFHTSDMTLSVDLERSEEIATIMLPLMEIWFAEWTEFSRAADQSLRELGNRFLNWQANVVGWVKSVVALAPTPGLNGVSLREASGSTRLGSMNPIIRLLTGFSHPASGKMSEPVPRVNLIV